MGAAKRTRVTNLMRSSPKGGHRLEGASVPARLQRVACLIKEGHDDLQGTGLSPLSALLSEETASTIVIDGKLRPWLELMIHSVEACTTPWTSRATSPEETLDTVLAAFAASVLSLDILDDLIDGDPPCSGCQAPNVATALFGESLSLLATLPCPLAQQLLSLWGRQWTKCAAAQAQDVAIRVQENVTAEQALTVAAGSGFVTQWAVEAGAIVAGAPDRLIAPLRLFGQHVGTMEKLLHDLHDVWPGGQPSRDLRRPSCNLALVAARSIGVVPALSAPFADDSECYRLLTSGVLHYVWACADEYRVRASEALTVFARAGGDVAPLQAAVALR